MAEILTESFCERCGTRYTFEATTRRRLGIGRIRRLSRGVRNFVSNDDASFSEAMATAREDDTRSASSRQLDAFHRSFNFCMSCRQYTCRNCWNSGVGECLSCAPDLGVGVLPAASPDLAVVGPETHASTLPESAQFAESAHPNVAASAWPTSDLRAAPEAAAVAGLPAAKLIDATEPDATEPVTEIDATALVTETELTPKELVAIQSALTRHVGRPDGGRAPLPAGSEEPAELDVAEIPRAAVEAAPIVAEPGGTPQPTAGARLETRRLLQRFRPRRDRTTPVARPTASTDPTADAVAVAAPAVAAIVVEPAVAAELTAAEPAVAAVAAVAAAPAAAVPEVAAAAPEPPSMAPEPAAAAPASPPPDVAVQPTWSMVAPDGAPPGEPRSATPAWATPQRVTRREADAMPSAPWAARVATARPLESPVWAASSRHILTAAAPGAARPVGIQSCVSCGLSLSANARFCRRCGTRQA